MCVAVRYSLNGDFKVATIGIAGHQLPVLERGRLSWYLWGSQGDDRLIDREQPGHIREFPPGYHVARAAVRDLSIGNWWHFKPQPVKVAVSAFMVLRDRSDGTTDHLWIDLKPGEFLQGAKCALYATFRVYVVVEDAVPPGYSGVRPPWPRVVKSKPRAVRKPSLRES